MAFKIQIQARADREAQIQKSLNSPSGREDFYDFRSEKMTLPIIRIGINLPVYRMENFRTFTDQREHIAKENLSLDYFASGQEIESIQQVQHELLVRLARKGVSDSVVPVIEVLKREKQREHLLITSSGVVVNGNRRLAAMRELYSEDHISNSEFGHTNCLVLPPDATADEIVDIEASLQAKPETKLDYDWIGDGQLIFRLVSMGRSPLEVADRLNRSKPEIENSLQALVEADLYLKDWANAEGEYSKIRDDAEQLFKDLPKQIKGKTQHLQDLSRIIAWVLYDNRESLSGRIYDFNPAFGKLATDVLDRMAEELDLSTEPLANEDDDSFDIDLECDDGDRSYDALIDALKNEETKDAAVEALIKASQDAIETEKGQKSGEAAYKALTQVHSKLAAVDLSRASKETYNGIGKQLEAILTISKKLSEKITELTGS